MKELLNIVTYHLQAFTYTQQPRQILRGSLPGNIVTIALATLVLLSNDYPRHAHGAMTIYKIMVSRMHSSAICAIKLRGWPYKRQGPPEGGAANASCSSASPSTCSAGLERDPSLSLPGTHQTEDSKGEDRVSHL